MRISNIEIITNAIQKDSSSKLLFVELEDDKIVQQITKGYEEPRQFKEAKGLKIIQLTPGHCYVTASSKGKLPNGIQALFTNKHAVTTIEYDKSFEIIGIECLSEVLWKIIEEIRSIAPDC